MKIALFRVGWSLAAGMGLVLSAPHFVLSAEGEAASPARANATVVEMEGTVQTARARSVEWRPARTNEGLFTLDRVRTREQSRAALRLMDRSLFRLGELSELTVEPRVDPQSPA